MQRVADLSGKAAVLVVLLAASILILQNLGGRVMTLYDEGTYAKVVEESIERKDFLTFTYGGKEFFDKPPLYFWLSGITSLFTEDRELMIRLPAALSGMSVVALTMLLAYFFTRSRILAALSGLLLIATPAFVEGAREARLDLLVSFFSLLSIYAFLRAKDNAIWFLVVGSALALAILSKNVIAIFAFIAICTIAIQEKWFSWIKDRYAWRGAALGALIVLPWHIYETVFYGREFWLQYVGYHIFERYEENLFGSSALQADYMFHLTEFAPLITALTLMSLVYAPIFWIQMNREVRVGFVMGGATLLIGILLFFTAETRAFSYLLPLYPFAALCVVYAASTVKIS